MKITLTFLMALLTLFLAATITQDQKNDELQVVYNLSGVIQELENKELTVTFSDDMLPLGGKREGASLVRITPAVKGEFFWRGNRTLAFKPEPRFRYSTTYTAEIPAGTRSLAGKVLLRAIRWQWSTPQAYPVGIKIGSREYFSQLTPGEKLDNLVWVKEAMTLRFNQPVAATDAKSFFILKEAKSDEPAAILISQKTPEELEILCPKGLKRGLLYQLSIKKDFCGSEGNTGTAKDFSFTFDTVPVFGYQGDRPLVLYPDSRYCQLPFSNALAEEDPALIKIYKISGKERTPLMFRLELHHYENQALFIAVDDKLASGDRLSIRVDRNLTNIYKERLPENLELEANVCSSRSPRLDFSLKDNKLSMTANSMKQASVRLLKLKPEFYTQLTNRDFGMLQQKDFKARLRRKRDPAKPD